MEITEPGYLRLSEVTAANTLGLLAICLTAWTVYGIVYRLYLSPIAHIPGPLTAKLTFWHEFYYDVWLGGKYTFVLPDYHKKYGPVVRINPYEIHIMDSEFYDELYWGPTKGKTDKWAWAMRMFGQYDNSAFDTLKHEKHRMRREPWAPYFSKASVARLQPLLIQQLVGKLCDRFAEFQDNGKPVVMTHAYACLTADVISEYSFPEGYGLLDRKPNFTFNSEHYGSWMALSKMSHLLKQFGWLFPLLDSMPPWLTYMTAPPEISAYVREQQKLLVQTREIGHQLEPENARNYKESTGRPSIMEAIYTSPALPAHEKHPERVNGEAIIAMGAGTLTSSHALKHATYHILSNAPILDRLMKDLEAAIPDLSHNPPDMRKLESIDYLVAIMYESLRIFSGTTHRLSRIFPERTIVYGSGTEHETIIPPGTPVGMTPMHIHEDERIFPNPRTFDPDRWLPLQTKGAKLMKYFLVFGKGPRQCVGVELAKAEIMTALAYIFLKFGRSMYLIDCVRERDVDTVYDVFNPLPSRESNGLLVGFRKE